MLKFSTAARPAVFACLSALLFPTLSMTAVRAERPATMPELKTAQGLCIQIGLDEPTLRELAANGNLLVHSLDADRSKVERLQQQMLATTVAASLQLEHWTKSSLPHADNLANLVIVHNEQISQQEIKRVLRPGGVALICTSSDVTRIIKPELENVDEWTHQWHATDGGLTSEDERVGIPTGVQWISGPLFAMAGRKSSTQTLVTSGGINFYVTQNVEENVGRPVEQTEQYLIAVDSYNGLLLWKQRWTGPFVTGNGETNPRMIASPEALFAVTDPRTVVAIDPGSGDVTSRFQLDEAHQIDKIVRHEGRLLVQSQDRLTALDTDLTAPVWHFDGNGLSAVTLAEDRVFLLSSGRSPDGRFLHELICLNGSDGSVVFQQNTQPDVTAARVRINFATDGYVALQAHGSLHMFDSGDGHHLWTRTTEARPGKTYVDERYVGHFYRRGLVWMLSQNSPRESAGQNIWLALDPATGETVKELTTTGEWPRTDTPAKMGCQVLIASDRYIMIPRQATFIDFDSGEKHSFKFTRGGCGLGFVPANGLLYSHPHACGCFSEALRGFMGMHSLSEPAGSQAATAQRLQFVQAPQMTAASSSGPRDWAIHRGESHRSGFAPTDLGNQLTPHWDTEICPAPTTLSRHGWKMRTGNAVSAPTISGQMVFVADVDAGRIMALNAGSGQPVWSFQAAGRIDSPPTIHQGVCVFGSHDGHVYCVQADSGALCWKYRAAPSDRRIIAYAGVESAWPVAGTTLVRDGVVYVAAGRAPDADGGIHAIALHLDSGQPVWQKQMDGGDFRGLSDFFVNGEDRVYLANWQFDPQTGDDAPAPADTTHLQGGKAGLLEASWSKHDLAIRKNIQTWTAAGAAGQILAWSPTATASFDAEARKLVIDSDEHFEVALDGGVQITAMALTNDHLVVAGGTDRSDSLAEGFLQVINVHTGKAVQTQPLSAEACFDGMAIVGPRVYVSTQDGRLHCLTTK